MIRWPGLGRAAIPGRPAPLVAARLALFYAAVFAVGGILLPFWPSWLDARGVTKGQIGVLLAAGMAARIVATPLIARIADRTGERKRLIVLLATASFGCWTLFYGVTGFWALLAVSMLAQGCSAATMPLVEDLTLATARARKLDYGRIRLAGSVSFLSVAAAGGVWLTGRPNDSVLVLMLAMAASVVVAAFLLPATRPTDRLRVGMRAGARLILGRRGFQLMFLASGLIQASHMVFYGFGTLHWRAAGISDGVIGWLWAEGVIAEIVLFWYGAPLLRRFQPAGLMLLGGGLGAVRWIATGLTTDVTFLVGLQALHGFSFGATHLGAMHFLKDHARAGLSATAQGLHSALAMGLLGGLTMMGAGPLFGAVGAGAFQAMAVMAALGAMIAWRLKILTAERIAAGLDESRR